MKSFAFFFPFVAFLVGPALAQPAPAQADPPPADTAEREEARIPFANRGGIRDWKAVDRDTVYFQDRQRRWYRAELFSPATGVEFVQFIGIETGPSDTFDRFSSLFIDGQKYAISSLVMIEGEPPEEGAD